MNFLSGNRRNRYRISGDKLKIDMSLVSEGRKEGGKKAKQVGTSYLNYDPFRREGRTHNGIIRQTKNSLSETEKENFSGMGR